jgi:hypothetical protein
MIRKSHLAMAAAVMLAVPATAWGNVGTPLMWAGTLHLVFGNLIIGTVEGLLLARVFQRPRRLSVLSMIVANYASAWGGMLFLAWLGDGAGLVTLDNIRLVHAAVMPVAFAATVILEWPFVALCFRRSSGWFKRSVLASLLVQTVTCLPILGWYTLASVLVIPDRLQVVPLADMSLPPDVLVYYIAERDGNVYRRPLAGPDELVHRLDASQRYNGLLVSPSMIDSGRWDLRAGLDARAKVGNSVTVCSSFASRVARRRKDGPEEYPEHYGVPGSAACLGNAEQSPWRFSAGFSVGWGLHGVRENGQERMRFAVETPLVTWSFRYLFHLPGDKVLFQLGRRQICVLDPVARKMAIVAYGRAPVAVMKEDVLSASSATSSAPATRKAE